MLESRAAEKAFDHIHKKYGPESLEVLTTYGDIKIFNQCKIELDYPFMTILEQKINAFP